MQIKIDPKFHKEIAGFVDRVNTMGGKALDECYDIVRVLTDKVQEEAVKRAPVDEGFLEKSIEKKMMKGKFSDEISGVVYIPSNAPASQYAWYMHELTYKLGARSQAKQAASKVVVGRKYIQRALDENVKALTLYIVKRLREFCK